MDKLYTYFPVSRNVAAKDIRSLIISIAIYLVACLVMGIVQSILGPLPIVGWILGLAGGVLELYCVVGIVLSLLKFFET